MAGCRHLYMMMSRVKSSPLPPLVSKASEAKQQGMSGKAIYSLAIVSAASAYTVAVVAKHVGLHFPICYTIGLISALLSGMCLIEFMTSYSHGGQSVYSCIYQSISEISAYIVGWMSLLSSCAVVAVLCLEFSVLVDAISNHEVSKFVESTLTPSCPDLLPQAFIVLVVVISVSGISYASCWIITSTVVSFLVMASISGGMPIIKDKSAWLPFKQFFDDPKLPQILSGTALCISVFLGPQNILRFPTVFAQRNAVKAIAPLNFLCYLASLACGTVLILTQFYSGTSNMEALDIRSYVMAILPLLPICLLAIEYYNPFMTAVQDMSADGLIFRSLAKRWKSCCQRVPSLWTFVITGIMASLTTLALSLDEILKVAAVSPLFVNGIVAVTVLRERYKDRDYWQYEPMLQNGGVTHHRFRKRSTEFLPRGSLTEVSSPFQVTDISDSEDSSETDIDSVVQDYKESVKLAGLTKLDDNNSSGILQEPTRKTSTKARFLILAYVVNCLILTISCTVIARTNISYNALLLSLLALTAILCIVILCFLRRLPQSWSGLSTKCRMRSCFMPWIPGLAFILSLLFLVHIAIDIWHVLLCWSTIGFFMYLVYGMRNSTAATSFYGMPNTAQLSLQPFPFLRESNVRKVILPERKHRTKRKI